MFKDNNTKRMTEVKHEKENPNRSSLNSNVRSIYGYFQMVSLRNARRTIVNNALIARQKTLLKSYSSIDDETDSQNKKLRRHDKKKSYENIGKFDLAYRYIEE